MIKVTQNESFTHAAASQMKTLIVALIAIVGWLGFLATKEDLSVWEASAYPVLTDARYDGDRSYCDDDDAVVFGYMTKWRGEYIDGKQIVHVFLTGTDIISRRRVIFMDQPPDAPTNRLAGELEFGPWKIVDACNGRYDRWSTVVEHSSWHPFWTLKSTMGPFPLPTSSGQ